MHHSAAEVFADLAAIAKELSLFELKLCGCKKAFLDDGRNRNSYPFCFWPKADVVVLAVYLLCDPNVVGQFAAVAAVVEQLSD